MHEHNLHRRRPGNHALSLGAALGLLLPACLDRDGGQISGGFVGVTTVTASTTGGADTGTGTTFPGIMTTTFEPVDTDSGTSGPGPTEPIPDNCGNGVVEDDEQCDYGDANANEKECTLTCKWATCGDGYIRQNLEECDDAGKNGLYGHCADDCMGPGPFCGDGIIQADHGEYCDEPPTYGCLANCQWATTCVDLKESWGDQVKDGIYALHRMSQMLPVWCAMEADGGGYTILKHAATYINEDLMIPEEFSAKQAEQKCSTQYGMKLLVPRSAAHLEVIAAVASTPQLGPVNYGGIANDAGAYLRIFGIYPETPGQSCVGEPLNSTDCPEWQTRPKVTPYWLTSTPLGAGQPGTFNCEGCSMEYVWDMNDPPELLGYTAIMNGGVGAKTTHFLCEIGDKLPD